MNGLRELGARFTSRKMEKMAWNIRKIEKQLKINHHVQSWELIMNELQV